MMRASSPPEAILAMGRRSSPTLADIRNRMVSQPSAAGSFSAKSMTKRIFFMSRSRSSRWMRSSRALAASLRTRVSSAPAVRTAASAFFSFRSSRIRVSSAVSMASSSARHLPR